MNTSLRRFVLDQMKQRDMSARQFAAFIGVSNDTINRMVNDQDDSYPSSESLVKLAKATRSDLTAIFGLAFPDVAALTAADPDSILLAQQLRQLPQTAQDFILTFVRSQKPIA